MSRRLFQITIMYWKNHFERYKGLLVVLLFVLTLMILAQLTGLRENFSLAFLRQTLSDHRWSGLLAFVLLFCLGNLAQVPGWIFLASAVLVFGQLLGGLITYVAAVTSCVVTFMAVGWMGGAALRRFDNRFALRLLDRLHTHPVRNIVLLRTVFQTLPALNYTLALSGIGLKNYLVGTLLGLPLPIAVYCLLFDFLAAHVFNAG